MQKRNVVFLPSLTMSTATLEEGFPPINIFDIRSIQMRGDGKLDLADLPNMLIDLVDAEGKRAELWLQLNNWRFDAATMDAQTCFEQVLAWVKKLMESVGQYAKPEVKGLKVQTYVGDGRYQAGCWPGHDYSVRFTPPKVAEDDLQGRAAQIIATRMLHTAWQTGSEASQYATPWETTNIRRLGGRNLFALTLAMPHGLMGRIVPLEHRKSFESDHAEGRRIDPKMPTTGTLRFPSAVKEMTLVPHAFVITNEAVGCLLGKAVDRKALADLFVRELVEQFPFLKWLENDLYLQWDSAK